MAGKSLGTLTIDLIARTGGFVQGMDKAERSSQKWRITLKKMPQPWVQPLLLLAQPQQRRLSVLVPLVLHW
ncbi:Uncharacterised protein [Klebsiella pneumoniae]|uniref:Uncharacterized protein n=1 Tax=Klebsiella pneumoniae TaxID=573 RepID=A0A377WT70_KLEPN|nr:Uncharacterised protein [Klebsiella pneumoniae]